MAMKLTQHISRIKTIRAGEADFMLQDGMMISPRAGFEINQRCPLEYRQILRECIDNGWIKPVAHVFDSELMWDRLSEQSNETIS